MERQFNFTKQAIEDLPLPETRIEYRDEKIPELRLRVTATGVKSFSVFKRVSGGSPVRITLGKYPGLSPVRARTLALKHLADLCDGVNPNEQRRVEAMSAVTLGEAFEGYKLSRKLKVSTLRGYEGVVSNHLKKLVDKSLKDIDRRVVADIHAGIASKAQADLTMRVLRAIFNFAKDEYRYKDGSSIFPENPTEVLSHRKQWNNVPRRHTHIRPKELSDFYEALSTVRSQETPTGQSVCDAMLFALLTGLRRGEIFGLKWSEVNLRAAIFTIPGHKTKNGLPLELPITKQIDKLFQKQKSRISSEYVFAAENEYGQVREPKKVVAKVKTLSGTRCDFHDLRRTFATTAEHLDVGSYKLKRLMNHSTGRDDVTAGYVILTAETLRPSAEKIQNFLIGMMLKSKVVDIKTALRN
ncbi:tyrosine-type recombinase/integrase [Gynuella sunshinyii]|uniref:Site-specific recombinase XerD n=1 Tax=Gynuella sunshinyii YC6258 TaxID=1445510 RepID=A0A0C5VC46_9GAMM|nr:integrase family protein [Gynuella sunshinyii]AJQ96930.1 site-specific recombinase XerD [Gynuella sunshinyii YC6258]